MTQWQSTRPAKRRKLRAWGRVGIQALPLALVAMSLVAIRLTFHFYLDLVAVHGASCAPTLIEGDYLIARKLKGQTRPIKRGEIVMISGAGVSMLKRVIGLPGEDILLRDGRVYIDGRQLPESYLDARRGWTRQTDWPTTAPDSERVGLAGFFVMGDNRDASADSRSFGPIPSDDIAARVLFRVWPMSRISRLS